MDGIRALVFDAFGTLVDWRGGMIAHLSSWEPHRSRAASLAADASQVCAPRRRQRKTAPRSPDLRCALTSPAIRLANAKESCHQNKLQSLSDRLFQQPAS